METAATYKPSTYYFRAALRAAATKEEAVEVGLHVVAEIERLRAWVRTQGLMPPKWLLVSGDAEAALHAGEVCPFPMSAARERSPA